MTLAAELVLTPLPLTPAEVAAEADVEGTAAAAAPLTLLSDAISGANSG